MRSNEVPAPGAAAWTCVYILRRSDGWMYCGETDNLTGRLEAHRAAAIKEHKAEREKNNDARDTIRVEMAFLKVPKEVGGKSAARKLESSVIQRLKAERIPLLSGVDARNTSFGSAT